MKKRNSDVSFFLFADKTMLRAKQYDTFILSKDLNPNITKGMQGIILEIWTDGKFEVEFVKEDGSNREHDGHCTFTIDDTFIDKLVDK